MRLPRRLDHARHFTRQRELPETNPAQLELAEEPAGTPAAEAAVPVPAGELRLLRRPRRGQSFVSCDLCGCCHVSPASKRTAKRCACVNHCCVRNGMPRCLNNAIPSASVLAVVVMHIFIPFALSTLL